MQLSRQQQEALDQAVTSRESLVFTGEAGTGKTLLIRAITDKLREGPYKRVFHVCAMTGPAAVAINGSTLHSFLGVGLFKGDPYQLAGKINRSGMLKKRWKTIETILLDEIGMLTPYLMRRIHDVAQIVRESNEPFGGIQILFFGDFAQCPPIYTENEPQEGPYLYAFEDADLFPPLERTFLLTEIFRQKDPVFQGILSRIRLANETKEDYQVLKSRLIQPSEDDNIRPVDLYARKMDVERINNLELEKLQPDKSKWEIYKATQKIVAKTAEQKKMAENLVLAFRKIRSAPDELTLAVGAQVLLTKNLDVSDGLCNGASGVVERFEQIPEDLKGRSYPVVRFVSGQTRLISPCESDIEYQGQLYAIDLQVPLILAWAITIHKAQGKSLTRVSLALDEHVRQPGQGYTGLSRATTLEGLYLKSFSSEALGADSNVAAWYENLQKRHDEKEKKRIEDENNEINEKEMDDLLILEADKVEKQFEEKKSQKRKCSSEKDKEGEDDNGKKISKSKKQKKEKPDAPTSQTTPCSTHR